MFPYVFYVIASYFVGSIPVGVMLAKIKGVDPRKGGSKNIGATNVMRTAGRIFGILTLIGDMLKGFVPTLLAILYGVPASITAAIGIAAFLGHLFPVYLRFKGGKGVATASGVYLAMNPWAILISFIVFLLMVFKWRYVSLGSITGASLTPFLMYFLNASPEYILSSVFIGLLIIAKHRENIGRLIKGKENRLNLSSK
ncbi:MAG: glycerol-3-phosphate 1-O-acyltransferase PlsY [Syntrophorhabdaceae bacterium]|nr:glycerol-3-phosphate 1-O-acyltransferase PlsY [Syntrophorhabdaceae bacterium]